MFQAICIIEDVYLRGYLGLCFLYILLPLMPLIQTHLTPHQSMVQPTFSSGWVAPVAATLSWMERTPLADILVKDIVGMNAPQIGIAAIRSEGDLWDTTRMELTNTSLTVLGSILAAPLFRRLASVISKVSNKDLNKIALEFDERKVLKVLDPKIAKKQLAHLAGAFGFLIPFAASFISSPYIRNAMTLKQTGTIDFEEIIGLKSTHHQVNQKKYKKELTHQTNMIKWINGVGIGLGLAVTVGLGLASRRLTSISAKAGKRLHQLFKTFRLGGNKAANQVKGDLSVFIWWLAPAYVGYIASARSHHERREVLIKAVNTVLWFTAFNRFITKPAFGKKFMELQKKLMQSGELKKPLVEGAININKQATGWFKKRSQLKSWIPDWAHIKSLEKTAPSIYEQFSKLKSKEDLTAMGISIAMLATTPSLINLFLTKQQFNKNNPSIDSGLTTYHPSWVTIRQNPLYYLAPLSHE